MGRKYNIKIEENSREDVKGEGEDEIRSPEGS